LQDLQDPAVLAVDPLLLLLLPLLLLLHTLLLLALYCSLMQLPRELRSRRSRASAQLLLRQRSLLRQQ
jgi:hypothetical protein